MIATWMLYALAIAVVFYLMALMGERLAEICRVPRRWIWVGALSATLLSAAAVPLRRPIVTAPQESVLMIPDAIAPAEVPYTLFDRLDGWAQQFRELSAGIDSPLTIAWGVAASVLLLGYGAGMMILRRRRRIWRESLFQNVAVLVAPNDGPAIVGVFAPRIVVPEWALDLDPAAQRMILVHEEEHLRAGDPMLLRLASATLLLMPWNLPLWAMMRRLRLTVELDCDQRVLRRTMVAGQTPADAPSYAELLLTVASQRSPTASSLAPAFLEPHSSLRRRITAMSPRPIRWRGLQFTLFSGAWFALAAIAITLPAPRLVAQGRGATSARTTSDATMSAAERNALLAQVKELKASLAAMEAQLAKLDKANSTWTERPATEARMRSGAQLQAELAAAEKMTEKLRESARTARLADTTHFRELARNRAALDTERALIAKMTDPEHLRMLREAAGTDERAKLTSRALEAHAKELKSAEKAMEQVQKVMDKLPDSLRKFYRRLDTLAVDRSWREMYSDSLRTRFRGLDTLSTKLYRKLSDSISKRWVAGTRDSLIQWRSDSVRRKGTSGRNIEWRFGLNSGRLLR